MNLRTIGYYENRIHLLKQRDPVINAKLIKKLERQKRRLEAGA